MIRWITCKMVLLCACLCLLSLAAAAQDIPTDYRRVLKSLDRKGDFKDGVLKVNVPRNDLKMTVAGAGTPTPFGFANLRPPEEAAS